MIRDTSQIKWSELKSKIRQQWSKLTEEDISRLNGEAEELISLLRKRYGYGKAQAEIEINNWLRNLELRGKKGSK